MRMDWRQVRDWLLSGEKGPVLIASHRGKWGGNVIENTVTAFENAIFQGADLLEMDLELTADGHIVCHHDPDMRRLFHRDGKIGELRLEDLMELPVYNGYGEPSGERLSLFSQVLEAFRGRAMLVLDRCWDFWDEVDAAVKKAGMERQVILKFYTGDEKSWEWAADHREYLLFPMMRKAEDLGEILSFLGKAAVVGVEILPDGPEDPVLSGEYIAALHGHGLKVWCNSLSYSTRLIFGGGYDDNLSLRRGGDAGWGQLVSRGVDIIQTDWVFELADYLQR